MTNDYRSTAYPITGKASRYYAERGYARLASVEVEQWLEPVDYSDGTYSMVVGYGHVAMRDIEGNVWVRDIKRGENEHQIAQMLASRGYTTGFEALITN